MIILGVETSCDDSSVALVREDGFVLFNQVRHQNSIHEPYGGVVPELASRNHLHHLLPLVQAALNTSQFSWKDIDALSVTTRPGLTGSLMVGLVTVKTLALLLNKPFIGVNHLEGHLLSPFLWDKTHPPLKSFQFPYLALVVSGAHTHLFKVEKLSSYILVGKTLDDGAGEAFDKFATMLNLSYPGGVAVDREALKGKRGKYTFPKVVFKKKGIHFSFSGLKTKASLMTSSLSLVEKQKNLSFLCADYQEAIVEQLMRGLNQALEKYRVACVAVTGGVSANSRLRERVKSWAKKKGVALALPALPYCTDNAAMIAKAGFHHLKVQGKSSPHSLNCQPSSHPGDFTDETAQIYS